MTDLPTWHVINEWFKEGTNYRIVIRQATIQTELEAEEGPYRWFLYAYIYPPHPRFATFTGDSFAQEACSTLCLHGGVSYLHRHYQPAIEGKGLTITSIQVGADYHHLGDTAFTFYSTPEEATEVFHDAEALYALLGAENDWQPTQEI